MGFYEVTAKCGHVGKGRYYQGLFYVQAENGKTAAAIVRNLPRVKHDRKDAIIAVAKVDFAVFMKGIVAHQLNPYFDCHNKQEQDLILSNIAEFIYSETDIDYDERRLSSDRQAKIHALLRYYRKMDKYYSFNIGA
ncbi:MAG: hypothetical protein LBI14_01980 [Treponema sp.]|jgi:hypothetical protein|nr:hypothetical protein [Treponema sp.]